MEYGIDAFDGTLADVRVTDIAENELDRRRAFVEVVPESCSQVIQHAYPATVRNQPSDDVRTDEARTPSDEYARFHKSASRCGEPRPRT